MKVGIATTLSIAGVLAAGAAAFAVNSSVLSASTPTSATFAPELANMPTPSPSPLPVAVTKRAAVQSFPVTDKVTTYEVGTSGSVVIDTTNGSIVVTNVIPAAGWTSEPARTSSDGTVKVHFISASARIEFIARMIDGKVKIEVQVEPISPATPLLANTSDPVPPTPVSTPAYHDDDDDEKEDHDEDDDDEKDDDDDDEDEDDD